MSKINVVIATVCLVVFTTALVTRLHSQQRSQDTPATQKVQPVDAPIERIHLASEKRYSNARYHYELWHVGAIESESSSADANSSDLISITIDSQSDPIHICAADNPLGWNSKQLFEEWKRNPPLTRSRNPTACADYPSYARVTGSPNGMTEQRSYQVVSFRGRYETVCNYIVGAQMMLAICLPPEDPTAVTWPAHFETYKRILTSVKIQ